MHVILEIIDDINIDLQSNSKYRVAQKNVLNIRMHCEQSY